MYQTTSERGLRFDSVPMRLFEKAKRLGIWNPSDIDLSADREQWRQLSEIDRDFVLRLVAQFQAGEEAVTLDLLPLVYAVAHDGHLEEEIFLTSFLWEEAKHTNFFRRWLDEVSASREDLSRFMSETYNQLFDVELATSMHSLLTDQSREAQAIASTTYNMIVEGVLAETGYRGFRRGLEQAGLLPGLLEGITNIARDESRHIRYGVFLLERLVSEDDGIWDVIQKRMNELLPYAMKLIGDFWAPYDEAHAPFGLTMGEFVDYAATQFDKRMKVLERDRGKALSAIEAAVLEDIDAEERELAEVAG